MKCIFFTKSLCYSYIEQVYSKGDLGCLRLQLWRTKRKGDSFPFDPGVLVDDDGSVYL